MFEQEEQNPLTYLKQFSPIHRFSRVLEKTIEQAHPSPSILKGNFIKILSWNIAKNHHESQWSKDFLTIVAQNQPDLIFWQEVRLQKS